MVVEGVSQQFQFNHYCGLFITSLNCACRALILVAIVCCH